MLLDPVLEKTFTDIQDDLDHITVDGNYSEILIIFITVVRNTSHWWDSVKPSSTDKKLDRIVEKLHDVYQAFSEKADVMIRAKQVKNPNKAEELELTNLFIKEKLLDRLSSIAQMIAVHKTSLQQLRMIQGNTKEVKNYERELEKVVNEANRLIKYCLNRKFNERFLSKFIHFHISREKLEEPIRDILQSYVVKMGYECNTPILFSLLHHMKDDASFDFVETMGTIWRSAHSMGEQERQGFIHDALEKYLQAHRNTIETLIPHVIMQHVLDKVRDAKKEVREVIDYEYANVPQLLREEFEIFQNGAYYASEWEFNKLITDLQLGLVNFNEVDMALEKIKMKWMNPQFIKDKFCEALREDWRIELSRFANDFKLYCSCASAS